MASRCVPHSDGCECVLLARAVGAPPEAIDFAYCHNVLQKHWRLRCDHCPAWPVPPTPHFPPFDLHDPVQAVLAVNAPLSAP
jgi:hypothetical protein